MCFYRCRIHFCSFFGQHSGGIHFRITHSTHNSIPNITCSLNCLQQGLIRMGITHYWDPPPLRDNKEEYETEYIIILLTPHDAETFGRSPLWCPLNQNIFFLRFLIYSPLMDLMSIRFHPIWLNWTPTQWKSMNIQDSWHILFGVLFENVFSPRSWPKNLPKRIWYL